MARASKKCPPGQAKKNPPPIVPEEPVPPGDPVPEPELPPPEDPVPPPTEDPEPPPPEPPPPVEPPEEFPDPPPPEEPPLPEPPPEVPPPDTEWHRTLQDTTYQGDIIVPAGERWLIGPNVKVIGNVRTVGGTIGMRPGSSLEFLGADPTKYIGGGLTYSDEFALDFGIWVGPGGLLDVRGTPKAGWNRTGVIDTPTTGWTTSDEYWEAPSTLGDFFAKLWTPGSAVPQVDSRCPPTEIINVSRDVLIKGPGHIHIHSELPQRIEYCRLEAMGISTGGTTVLGRYALHLHHCGNITGTLIRGVAAINCQGHVFVPHGSHGTTWRDCVSVNSWGAGFWWDPAHQTNDVLVDRLCVCGVEMPITSGSNIGVLLGAGQNMEIRDSVVSGIWGGTPGRAFDWPEPTAEFDPIPNLVWTFAAGNVAHNNRGSGVRFWTNRLEFHTVLNYISYHNSAGSFENGAYFTVTQYENIMSFHDGYLVSNDYPTTRSAVAWRSNSGNVLGTQEKLKNAFVIAHEGYAFEVGHRQIPATGQLLVEDCTLVAGPGKPKIGILPAIPETSPWNAKFLRCGLVPDDVFFESLEGTNEGSHVVLENIGGTGWNIDVVGGVKVVTTF